MLSLDDIQNVLPLTLIGIVPESEDILAASNQGIPAIYQKGTDVSDAYSYIVDRFLGVNAPWRSLDSHRGGYFKRLLSGWH